MATPMPETGKPINVEVRDQQDSTARLPGVMITPAIQPDYWAYRVRLTDEQAIVGFPKFGTIGVGFAQEDDWNTNLPYTCTAEEIYEHIADNKGDDSIPGERCIEAIRAIQAAIRASSEAGAQ